MPRCRQCGNGFPNAVRIQGKIRNLQNRTACLACVPFKSPESRSRRADLARKRSTTNMARCARRRCSKKFRCHDYVKRRGGDVFCSPRCKTIEGVNRLRTERKKRAVKFKGGRCSKCGYSRCLAALHFHHPAGRKKEFEINRSMTMAWSRIVKELKKCILLCANCHAEEHANEVSEGGQAGKAPVSGTGNA
jgi:hypothetical protein